MPVISCDDAATHEATDLIRALKNPAPSAPFAPLFTEKLNVPAKLEEIFQGQIKPETKLETTETQTKIAEQGKI